MKRAYPVFIKQEGTGEHYLVFVPDFDINTESDSFEGAIEAARDAIGAMGVSMEKHGEQLPDASNYSGALAKVQKDADDIFDYSDGIKTFVDIDFTAYRNKEMNRAVKKNCTIPYWMNEKAEERGINFSKVLQDALMTLLENNYTS